MCAAALVVVLGAGAAVAASGSRNPASDFLGDVAKRLGISQQKLEDAIRDTAIAKIDEAVAAGKITKEQGDELKARVRAGDVPAFFPPLAGPKLGIGPFGPDSGRFHLGIPGTDLLGTAADYLGMTEADVRQALRNGHSLADLAKDKGKSVDGLKQALKDAIRKSADQAVKDGVITQEQANALVEKLSGAVDDIVDSDHGFGLGLGLLPKLGFGGPGPFGPGGLFRALHGSHPIAAAADYLGMSEADVIAALRNGKTLAQLAQDKGKSVEGLKKAITDSLQANLDQAVKDGVITKEQAQRLEAKVSSLVDSFVEGKAGSLEFGFGDRHGRFEFHFGIEPGQRDRAAPDRNQRDAGSVDEPLVPIPVI
jgi:lambda repressor-like predicted transcriptional regulator